MLKDSDVIAFVATARSDKARAFYEGNQSGLPLNCCVNGKA